MSHSSEIIHPSSDLDSDVLIKVDNVSKKFCRDFKKSLWYGLKDTAADILHPKHKSEDSKLRPSEFWANQNVSFEVKRGECFGLIGRNGAGKTTLLKILNGLIKPDTGSIEIRGRVSALIALGAGFNPLLTGRENVYVNGSILGLHKKEINAKLDEIIAFAEIEEAIDAPVRTYSSGMQVRLGFAVATTMNPDVLIIDEVLAVGDTAFKVRCYNRIKEILPKTAVIFVSHNMFDVSRICSQTLVMQKGQQKFLGSLEDGVHEYNLCNDETEEKGHVIHKGSNIERVNVLACDSKSEDINTTAHVSLEVLSHRDEGKVRVRVLFFDETQVAVAEWDSDSHGVEYHLSEGETKFMMDIEKIRLKSGRYRIVVIIADLDNHGYFVNVEHGLELVIKNKGHAGAPYKI